jgi:hypothetical protein
MMKMPVKTCAGSPGGSTILMDAAIKGHAAIVEITFGTSTLNRRG